MKNLYITDLDNTLLNDNGILSKYTTNIINEVINNGYIFSYATARSLFRAHQATSNLNIICPVVVHNGVFITHINSNLPVISHTFNDEENIILKNIFNQLHIHPFVYSLIEKEEKISYDCTYRDAGIDNYLNVRNGDIRLNPIKNNKNIYIGDIYYYLCIGTKEHLQLISDALFEDTRFNCIIQKEPNRSEYYCEIMPKEATKANAILQLKHFLGCDKIISFGDGINDIPMFKISDECYAVENAHEDLKKIATGIIPSNNDDGVAHWFLEHLLKK